MNVPDHAGVMQRDAERLAQMRCHTSRPGHPYQKFPWGNRKSLWEDPTAAGTDVRKDLVAYYRCVPAAHCCGVMIPVLNDGTVAGISC